MSDPFLARCTSLGEEIWGKKKGKTFLLTMSALCKRFISSCRQCLTTWYRARGLWL